MVLLLVLVLVVPGWLLWRCRPRTLTAARRRSLQTAAAGAAAARRWRILGCCGSGKSQLRSRLAQALQLPSVEMDAIFWTPRWVKRPPQECLRILARSLEGDAWILDGNWMSKPRDLEVELNREIWDRTQCVIWFDYDFWTVYFRAWCRTLWRIGSREPCCNGNHETWALLLGDFRNSIPYFVWTGHGRFQQKHLDLEQVFEGKIQFIRLQSQRETDYFLTKLAEFESAVVPTWHEQGV